MPQKLEFLSAPVALPNVIAIFFWILVISHCTPRYVSLVMTFSIALCTLGLAEMISYYCRNVSRLNRGRICILVFLYLEEILLLTLQILVLTVRTALWSHKITVVSKLRLLCQKKLRISILLLIGVEWRYLLIRFHFFSDSHIYVLGLFMLFDTCVTLVIIFSNDNSCYLHFCICLLKIKVPHPSYPSTCISIQVPNLGIHFSPARYRRLMELLNILYDTMEAHGQSTVDYFQPELAPWSPADLATDARILVWKVCS